MNTTHVITGLLSIHCFAEGDALFVSSMRDPLAKELVRMFTWGQKRATVRYWITKKDCNKEQAMLSNLRQLSGDVTCEFGAHYSEMTGYLWTDEMCKVGGHDLISELHSHVGKWLYMEIDIHTSRDDES